MCAGRWTGVRGCRPQAVRWLGRKSILGLWETVRIVFRVCRSLVEFGEGIRRKVEGFCRMKI